LSYNFRDGVGFSLAMVQQAALRMALSGSLRHLVTASEDDEALGCPMFPSSSNATSFMLLDLFLSYWVRVVIISVEICSG